MQVSIGVWIYVWGFTLIPLIDVSIFVPIPRSFFHYYSSVEQNEIVKGDNPSNSFIVQNYFSYCIFFSFPYEVEIVLSKSVNNCVDFDEDCTMSVDCFW